MSRGPGWKGAEIVRCRFYEHCGNTFNRRPGNKKVCGLPKCARRNWHEQNARQAEKKRTKGGTKVLFCQGPICDGAVKLPKHKQKFCDACWTEVRRIRQLVRRMKRRGCATT
jgi:hypothetical protein